MNHFYVYAYLRSKDSEIAEAGTPYYIGKGKGNPAFGTKHSEATLKKIERQKRATQTTKTENMSSLPQNRSSSQYV